MVEEPFPSAPNTNESPSFQTTDTCGLGHLSVCLRVLLGFACLSLRILDIPFSTLYISSYIQVYDPILVNFHIWYEV